jgi:hypothetical protein
LILASTRALSAFDDRVMSGIAERENRSTGDADDEGHRLDDDSVDESMLCVDAAVSKWIECMYCQQGGDGLREGAKPGWPGREGKGERDETASWWQAERDRRKRYADYLRDTVKMQVSVGWSLYSLDTKEIDRTACSITKDKDPRRRNSNRSNKPARVRSVGADGNGKWSPVGSHRGAVLLSCCPTKDGVKIGGGRRTSPNRSEPTCLSLSLFLPSANGQWLMGQQQQQQQQHTRAKGMTAEALVQRSQAQY